VSKANTINDNKVFGLHVHTWLGHKYAHTPVCLRQLIAIAANSK